jgi:phage shock protein A
MSVELGALCGSGDDAEKSASGGYLAKTENAELRKQLADLVPAIDTLTKQVQELRAQPMPPKAVTRTVTKVSDVGANEADDATVAMAKHLEALSPEERNKELMKLALKSGLPGHPAHSGH